MNEELFYKIYEETFRGGPGSKESTQRAYHLINDLPEHPLILDVGCGKGIQTIDLAMVTYGKIIALDRYQPFIDHLSNMIRKKALTGKVEAVKGDMGEMKFPRDYFDLIWGEGSFYTIGFEHALNYFWDFLKPEGFIAASELAWIRTDPPEKLSDFWKEEYPGIKGNNQNLEIIKNCGYKLINCFQLPKSDWMENYYLPLEEWITYYREREKDNHDSIVTLDYMQCEANIYRKFNDYYGYFFYIMQRD